MDTRRLPPALLMALGLAGCGGDDDGTATTGPCLDVAPMTESATNATESTGASATSGQTDGTTTGPCLDVAPMTTSSSESSGSSSDSSGSGSDSTSVGPCLEPPLTSSSGSESSSGSGGADVVEERDEVVRSLVGRGILPDDVAAKLGGK